MLFANNQLRDISIQLKWKYQFQFAGFIMAKEKGFYRDVGLRVELRELNNSIDITHEVESGKSHFGVGDSSLILDVMRNRPFVAMMAVFQQSPFVLVALKSSNIKTLMNINNKKISLSSSAHGIAIKAMLKSNNIKYTPVASDFNLSKIINKEIDLHYSYISNEPFLLKQRGEETTIFDPKDYGFEGYGDILYTTKDMVSKEPQLVESVYQASMRGWRYAYEHIDESVDIIYQKYNSLNKTKEALKYEAKVLKDISGYGKNMGLLDIKKIKSISQLFSFMIVDKYNLDNLDSFIFDLNSKPYSLNTKEVAYLKGRDSLGICIHSDKMPFEYIEDGRYIGLVSEYIDLITQKISTPIDIIRTKNNKELLKKIRNKECDIVPMVTKVKRLKRYLNFTSSYMELPIIIVTKNRDLFIDTLLPYQDKKWCVIKNSIVSQKLKKMYPKLKLIEVSSIYDGLTLVERKEVYGFVGLSMAVIYQIQNNFLDSLAITGRIDSRVEVMMATKIEDTTLHSILQKSLTQIDTKTKQDILNRWGRVNYKEEIDYTTIWQIIAIASLVFLILFYRQRTLKRYNALLEIRVQEELDRNRQHQLILMQQSRLAQMGEMISMIAHQWRQPLNSLSVIIHTMVIRYKLDRVDSVMMSEFEKDTHSQIAQMSQTIEDFSNFFKPNRKKSYFYISKQVNHSLKLLYPVLSKFDIDISFDIVDDCEIYGYPNELGQSIINIITNAKDTLIEREIDKKKIEKTLKIENNNIILSICDNAKGIDGDIIDKIFDPYFSTKEAKNGTGLGLYMSKMIIQEQMSGVLRVQNSDSGACFEILFVIPKEIDDEL